MNNSMERKMIAQETMQIIEMGSYLLHEQRVHLKLSEEELSEAVLISPLQIKEKLAEASDAINQMPSTHYCTIRVVNEDSYMAVKHYQKQGQKTMVLNFANAIYCGGGFLNGANAQEESLCRSSTLFASISSEDAKYMYEYNFMNRNPKDSDYMIVSPNVEVFRDASGELMESFLTSVITAPALDLNGRASVLDYTQVQETMMDRIQKVLAVAYASGIKHMILGAWGCGAFGQDAKDIAGYFKAVLLKEKYYALFDEITFAVMDHSREKYNYQSFIDEFDQESILGNALEAKLHESENQPLTEKNRKGFQTISFFPPAIPFQSSNMIAGRDLHVTAGYLGDGRPFLTELYHCMEADSYELIFLLPAKGLFIDQVTKTMDQDRLESYNEVPFKKAALLSDLPVLNIDPLCDSQAAEEIFELLVSHNVILPRDDTMPFDLCLTCDLAGQKIVACDFTIEERGKVMAECLVEFD